jgi:hypothetical protein
MVARLQLADAASHLYDDSGSLMAIDCRKWSRDNLIARQRVGMAHAGADDPDEDLVVPRIIEFDVFEREVPALFAHDCCRNFHRRFLLVDAGAG